MRKPEFNAALRQFAKNHLSPKDVERAFVARVYRALQDVLGERNCLQIGSYPRFTSVTPLHDLDVLYVLGPQGSDQSSADRVLGELRSEIDRQYQNPTSYSLETSRQTHSITISFLQGQEEVFAIDVVPAYIAGRNDFGQDTYLVPEIATGNHRGRVKRYQELANRHQQMAWIRSDPRGYIEASRMINERNSDFRKSIKIVKAWKQACCAVDERFKLKSFHLEQILVRTFAQQPRLEIFDALFGYFRELPALLVSPQIPDRADPSRMIDEYVAALTQSEREAVVEARDGFLIRLEEIEISAEIGSLVSGRSRKRRGAAEAYLFDQGIPLLTESEDLRIQGNVLPRAGGFRPEILDQTGLIDVDRRIRFSVTHGVASDLYKWKVKNDDSSPQPRGEISDHSTSSDPEHTQYKGSHFVECFAVRDGTCIARAKQNVVLK